MARSLTTLVELLRWRAAQQPERHVYTFLAGGGTDAPSRQRVSFAELDLQARILGAALQDRGAAGERVLLLYPPGLDFVAGFLGCLYAGAVAVPTYPPRGRRPQPGLRAVARDARPRVVLTAGKLARRALEPAWQVPELASAEWLATDELVARPSTALAESWRPPDPDRGALALLQYTSGSTAAPKGVMVTHGGLLHNQEMIRRAFQQSEHSTIVSWLPLYHDMGLIGGVLQPLYLGARLVLMSPLAFLQRPASWLEAISRYQATTSGGPNFAYELCVRKIGEQARAGLDLSSWDVAFNGAEPVQAATLERFAETFAPQGFRRQAFFPCYGLAEATLLVTGGGSRSSPERLPVLRSVAAEALAENRVVTVDPSETPADPDLATDRISERVRTLVGCGATWLGQEVVIVDPETRRRCPPERVGEIWVRGESVAQGYWRQPEASARDFGAHLEGEEGMEGESNRGPFLRTGDLGFLAGDQLFVTGRLKDLIILRGRNHYPQDIELTATVAHPALSSGGAAAFSVPVAGEEHLVVIHELQRRFVSRALKAAGVNLSEVAEAVRRAVAEAHEVRVHNVVLLRPATLPKTSSGKVQRHLARARYLDQTGEGLAIVAAFPLEALEPPAGPADALDSSPAALRHRSPGELRRQVRAVLRQELSPLVGIAVREISEDRSLISLGLDSMAALELHSALSARPELDPAGVPSLARLLAASSVAELAEDVVQRAAADDEMPDDDMPAADAAAAAAPPADPTELSHGEKALWFVQRLAPDSTAYHITAAAKVRGPLDVDALERATHALVARHPALRSTFESRRGEPRRQVHDKAPGGVFVRHEMPLDGGSESALMEELSEQAYRPFDLSAGPLVRIHLWRREQEHVLLLVIHHIVSDVWSLAVAARELGMLYRLEAGLAGGEKRRPRGTQTQLFAALPPPDGEDIRRRERWLSGPAGKAARAFWHETLADAPVALELPVDRPWPPVQSYSGGTQNLRLDADLGATARQLARSRDATLYMVFLAAFQALLARYTGTEDLVVGSPTAGRSTVDPGAADPNASEDRSSLMGYLVNPVVLRTDLRGDPGFVALLRRVRSTVLKALEHQDYPFPLLVERLLPGRDASRSPLFQVMFQHQEVPVGGDPHLAAFAMREPGVSLELGGLRLETLGLEERGAPFDLTLCLAELPRDGGTGLTAGLQYNTDLFDRTTVQRLLGHFQSLLAAALARPARRLSELPLLRPAEAHQLRSEWNGTRRDEAAADLRLDELFAAQVERTPDAIAVTGRGHHLTYRQLDLRADRLARHLRSLGVGTEARVGVLLERSPELVAALLAVLKAGGAYLPLDPGHPRERLGSLLADAGASVLLTRSGVTRSGATRSGATPSPTRSEEGVLSLPKICRMVDLAALPEGCSRGTRKSRFPLPDSALAYLIYTSGSTGRPKGVGVSHRALVNFLRSMARRPGLGRQDRVLAVTTVAFDIAALELFLPLTVGARVVLATSEEAGDGRRLAAALADSRATVLQATPATWQLLLEGGWRGDRRLRALCGGEALPPELAARLLPRTAALWNLYGPTETTVWSAVSRLMPGSERGRSISLGRPIANTRLHLLDAAFRPVPVGVPGMLYIAGEGLARGYAGQPRRSAESFVPDPAAGMGLDSGPPGGRLYLAGDRVRRLPDGRLDFLGRADHQLKVRGFRIEPGEIEAVLAEHDAVEKAAVVASSGAAERAPDGGLARADGLTAFVVPTASGAEDPSGLAATLREFLEHRLPAYMIPSAWVTSRALPLTSSGKVDRRALSLEAVPRSESGALSERPRGGFEEVLAEIWTEVLGVRRIGVHDNFFEWGGHSLLATRVAARIEETLRVRLPLSDLFAAPTIAGLARRLRTKLRDGREPEPTSGLPRSRPRPTFGKQADGSSFASSPDAPLSFAQQRLWFLHRLEPESPAYHIPAAARLRGALRAAVLERCLGEVVRRHEALRTTFEIREGQPVQIVAPDLTPGLPGIDFTALPEGAREIEAERLAERLARRPFDLSRGPLMRLALLRLGNDDHLLLLTLHHIVADGWAIGLLVHEVGRLYRAFLASEPSPLAPLAIGYRDFASWQRGWLRGEVLEPQLAYWRERLRDLPNLDLPVDHPRREVQLARGGRREVVLPPALVSSLTVLGRRHGATPFMVLLAVFQELLRRVSRQDDVAIGTPVANRGRRELEALIGLFANTLVLRTDFSAIRRGTAERLSFLGLLEHVRGVTLGAYAHEDLPFEALVEELNPSRDPGRNPLFQVAFVLQTMELPTPELPGLTLETLDIGTGGAIFDLRLDLRPRDDGGLCGVLDYRADLFDPTTIERLARHFQTLLAAVAARPREPLADCPWLSAAERHQLWVEWGETSRSSTAGPATLDELFMDRARATPDAVAVQEGESWLSYGQLAELADGLRDHLRNLGVGPDHRVGLLFEPSAEMVAAILGVLRAGAAYVPVNPAYPVERRRFMLADARITTLVASPDLEADDDDPLDGEDRRPRSPSFASVVPPAGPGEASPTNLSPVPLRGNLAYVIYTSGSTGEPKGVAVTHDNVLRLFAASRPWLRFGPDDVWTLFHSYAFDFSVWELWGALAHGGRLALVPRQVSRSPEAFSRLLVRQRVTVLNQTPTAFFPLCRAAGWQPEQQALHTIIFGGEALETALLAPAWREQGPKLVNMYGITETTVHVTYRPLSAADLTARSGVGGSPIGRPLGDLRVAVLDRRLRPLPVGVAGEMWVAGGGLARGYLDRPGLTAERFVPDPGGAPGERLYRSGDLGRWRGDGRLEYLGRGDRQVKIRGFRIEPGEIESVLKRHPDLADAAVMVHREEVPAAAAGDGEPQLVAYVVPEPERETPVPTSDEQEQLSLWRTVFDEVYSQPAVDRDFEPDFNIAGWVSSYTGRLLPDADMREWVDATVSQLRARRPRRVLEIGCGTGLLLLRLAQECERYVGTDLSAEALDPLRRVLAGNSRDLSHVELRQQSADDFTGLASRSFDAVVLSSVVQYFPGIDYLRRVLVEALRVVAPGGFIFLADLRSLPLRAAFHASVEFFKAPDTLPLKQLATRVRRRALEDDELLVDPAFFLALERRLPGIRGVRVGPRRGRFQNEITRFRYDAVLELEGDEETVVAGRPRVCLDGRRRELTFEGLQRLLKGESEGLEVTGVANRRLARERKILAAIDAPEDAGPRTVGELRLAMEADVAGEDGIDPEKLWRLPGYRVEVSWLPRRGTGDLPQRGTGDLPRRGTDDGSSAAADGAFDVILSPVGAHDRAPRSGERDLDTAGKSIESHGRVSRPEDRPWATYANDPSAGARVRRLIPELRDFLRRDLPEYMVPAAFVVLPELPRTAHGKLDRRALPGPEAARTDPRETFVAPRTDTEKQLAAIFTDLVGVEGIGAGDNFFDLGGHSLMATQLISRLRQDLKVELPLRQVFDTPTLAELASAIEACGTGFTEEPIQRRPAELQELPLSFSQQRLWLLEQLRPGTATYHIAGAMQLTGSAGGSRRTASVMLSPPALWGALREVVRRHEALRTRFPAWQGQPRQVVTAAADLDLPQIDLSGLRRPDRETEARRLAEGEARRPFDLESGPLLRCRLLRLEPADHLLTVTMHHIVADGWSLGVLVEEVAALYGALVHDRPSPLSRLPVQYADFARWQRRRFDAAAPASEIDFWRRQLADLPALRLPVDRPRRGDLGAAASARGGRVPFFLTPLLVDRLATLGDATRFVHLLAAFQTLLWRITGQGDLAVGTPVAGRGRSELEGLIGFFVNTLVLRGDFSPVPKGPSFRQLVARLHKTALAAYAHQDLPFEKLVEALQPERSLSHTPLFQVMFALQNAPMPSPELPGLTLRRLEVDNAAAKFELSLSLEETSGGGLSGTLSYAADLFDATTMRRFLGHFQHLLHGIVKAADKPLSEQPLLSPAEAWQLRGEWSDTECAADHPERRPMLPALLAAQAERAPDAVAVIFEDSPQRCLTWRELYRRASRLAGHLRALGVGPGELVAVELERGPGQVIAVLAILQAGGAYLPLDLGDPEQRRRDLLADARPRVVLRRMDQAEPGAGRRSRREQVVDPDQLIAERTPPDSDQETMRWPLSGGAATSALTPRQPAYVIYTSGSTGRPKGVVVEHRALLDYLSWAEEMLREMGIDRLPLITRLGFDASLKQLFVPLLRGLPVWMMGEETAADPGKLLAVLTGGLGRGEVGLNCVPSLWDAMLADMEERPADSGAGKLSLRALLLGGEALSPALVRRTRAFLPEVVMHNLYGPTEATANASRALVRDGRVSLGRPLPGRRFQVLDHLLRPLPVGVPGELWIGGSGLARGYLRRPAQTAECFLPDPVGGGAGGRLYRSGDLVRTLADGEVEFLGRADHQVKIRGWRIEPREVEELLDDHPQVRQAVVIAATAASGSRAGTGSPRLVACVEPAEATTVEDPRLAARLRDELRAHLLARLPGVMVPTGFTVQPLPRLPGGKPDRLTLERRAAARGRAEGANGKQAPRGAMEEIVAGIWSDVLSSPGGGLATDGPGGKLATDGPGGEPEAGGLAVAADDDFFALGGHSLLAVRVLARLRRALGVEVPLRVLFEAPTVAGFAARLEQVRRGGEPSTAIPRSPSTADDQPVPLSFAQQRLWFLQQLDPASPAYNVSTGVRLQGPLDIAALASSLDEIVRRHEPLRTVFPLRDGQPVQALRPLERVPLSLVDLSSEGLLRGGTNDRRVDEGDRLVRCEARRPFDLAHGPLLRVFLLRLHHREHLLFVNFHHIVADGWSLEIFERELAFFYRTRCRGESARMGSHEELPAPAVRYADYARWQRRQLSGERLHGELAHWRRRLAGTAAPELPTDRPRGASPSWRGGTVAAPLGDRLSGDLRAFSRRRGATLFMTLLAVFKSLLHRITGDRDLLVASPVAGRGPAEVEDLIGFFVNVVLLRTDLAGDPTFSELLDRVRGTALDAYSHQELPFERLIEELAADEGAGGRRGQPLTSLMFGLEGSVPEPSLAGVTARRQEIHNATAKFELTVLWRDDGRQLTLWLEYATDLFDATTVRRLASHLRTLMAAALTDPDRRTRTLPLLSAAESHQLVAEWNDTASEYPRGLVHSLFGTWTERTPAAVAVSYGDSWLSYGELDRRAERLAGVLRQFCREAGGAAEVPVGICMERSPQMVVAVLAVLKAGGVYVPLDPRYPAKRLAFMVKDVGAVAVVTSRQLAGAFASLPRVVGVSERRPRVVGVSDDAPATVESKGRASRPQLRSDRLIPDRLAYVMYTSGSTGEPKGVAVPHGAICRLVRGTDYVRLRPSDRVGQIANSSFDAVTFEIWGALLNGASLVGLPEPVILEPRELARQLAGRGVTAMFLTVALFNEVVRQEPAAFRGLNHLLVGGEAVDPHHVRRVLNAGAPGRLLNGYGPTENTTFTATHVITAVSAEARAVPIGRPIANTRVHLFDRGLEPVPVGVPGELYTGGDGLARGYFGWPALTAGRFVPNPYGCCAGGPGDRLYRTGDLVRAEADGRLEFLGRLDQQVKIRGFRIEPGEIEAVLLRHPGLSDAVVLVRRDRPSADHSGRAVRLVACVVAAEGSGRDARPLRDFLRRRLPEYMLPAAYLFLDTLPRTANGKLDRAALVGLEARAPVRPRGKDFAGPRTPDEEILIAIWAEVLGEVADATGQPLPRIGIHDDFFELGGHSLLATRVVSRLRSELSLELPLRALFEAPTVAGLAPRLAAARQLSADTARPPLVRRSHVGARAPLSFAQQRLWILDRFDPGLPAYNIPLVLRLRGALEPARLAAALDQIRRRHESLRTTFAEPPEGAEAGAAEAAQEPVQVVAPPAPEPLPILDLSALASREREVTARRLARDEARRRFDLARGPLLRLTLLRLGETEHVLVLVLHHIVADGWSLGILLREMAALYGEGASAGLAEPAVQYGDFAVWQRGWLRGAALEAQLDYWRRALAGAPALLELPTDRPRPAVQTFRGGRCAVELARSTSEALEALSQKRRATPFMALLSGFGALLSRLSGQQDLTFGCPIANRGQLEIEGLIGFFVNTLVLRLDLESRSPGAESSPASGPDFGELIERVRETTLGAYAHQDLPFEKLVDELQPRRSLAFSPLFQVFFALQNAPLPALELPGLTLTPMAIDTGSAKFDLNLSLERSPAGFTGLLEYNSDLYDATTMRRLTRQFSILLDAATAAPDQPSSELSLLAPAERQQLRSEWNDSGLPCPEGISIHQLIEARATRLGDETALIFRQEDLSYRELNRRANQLARHLARRGVGPGMVVGICLERGHDLVLAMLAVLKAGAAYLPLDPSYPGRRLSFMLQDSGAVLLITRRRLARIFSGPHPGPRSSGPQLRLPRILLDEDREDIDCHGEGDLDIDIGSGNLAYVIYTSGSTGRPKGVMVTHHNVVNFFDAMERYLGPADPLATSPAGMSHLSPSGGTWLAVTSASFDISVLELLYTLSRGFRVVIQGESAVRAPAPATSDRRIDFSLFYFASDDRDGNTDSGERYRLLLDGARFADRHEFTAVWTPERHFHAFGGLYPNPSVTGAAVAAVTERISIRAGSVVLPLHDPLRVAEEWSVVDNISGGRVAISFASGWHADDFVLAPENYRQRKEVMLRDVETVRRLWRGEAVRRTGGAGNEVEVRIHPPPCQAELPVWITAAGNPESFRLAGEMGAGILTHLLGQSIEELEEKIKVYRRAFRGRSGAGSDESQDDSADGHVTLMLHTFVGDDLETVRQLVREPFLAYLRSSTGLVRNLARSLDHPLADDEISEADWQALEAPAFERYFRTSGLMGTPDSCLETVDQLKAIGVDEVACLIDFGVETEAVLASLEGLAELRERSQPASGAEAEEIVAEARDEQHSLLQQLIRYGVSHLQCTPSMATMLARDPAMTLGLRSVNHLLLGGEVLPPSLVEELAELTPARIHNLYGPTETTIWSAAHRVDTEAGGAVPLGRPLANNRIHIFDRRLQRQPAEVPGQLAIAGFGVTRGYLGRAARSAESFCPDPTGGAGQRLYLTGDLARWRGDGTLEFLGRLDHQIKIRGYRIEPGEVEAALCRHDSVAEAAVVARAVESEGAAQNLGDPAQHRLSAYVVAARGQRRPATVLRVSPRERERLLSPHRHYTMPNGMVVAHHDSRQARGVYQEVYTEGVYLRHGIRIQDGDCIFDVGANTGFFTMFASQVCRPSKIYAFEPLPPNFAILRTNAALYGTEVEVFECGMAARPGEAEFTFYPNASGLSGRVGDVEEERGEIRAIVRHGMETGAGGYQGPVLSVEDIEAALDEHLHSETYRCRLNTISQAIRDHGVERIDLLKIDAEKSEVDILEGIAEEDWPRIRQLVLEVHGKDRLRQVRAAIEGQGYQVTVDEALAIQEAASNGNPDHGEVYVYMLYARRPEAVAAADEVAEADASAGELSARILRAFLSESLADHMVPSDVVFLDALPRTPNGKLDRQALPSPGGTRSSEAPYVAPRTQIESTIAAVWREVLSSDEVGIDDNFFEAGGNSLSMALAVGKLAAAMERQISIVEMFRFPTIRTLAEHLLSATPSRTPVPESAAAEESSDSRQAASTAAQGIEDAPSAEISRERDPSEGVQDARDSPDKETLEQHVSRRRAALGQRRRLKRERLRKPPES